MQGGTFRIPSQREMALPVTAYPQRLHLGELAQGRITLISNGGSQVTTAAELVRPLVSGWGGCAAGWPLPHPPF